MRNLSYLVCSAGVAAFAFAVVASAQPVRNGTTGAAGGSGGAGVRVQSGRSTAPDTRNMTSTGDERSFTKPSQEVDLAFSAPGLVTKVNIVQDEPVKAGQVLAEQDVTVEKANKATYEIEANSAVEEEYAIADVELKKVEFARKEKLYKEKNRAINELEVEEARLNVKRAEASVKLAQQKRQTAAAQAAVEQAKIDLKRIVSPIDGVVQRLETHPGEVATSQAEKPAIRVVRADPLWIDVNFTAEQASKLKRGQPLQVRYEKEEDKWMRAEVLSLQPVVRSGSQTQTVRLVMPNPNDVPPGREVVVRLPDATVAAAPGREASKPAVSDSGRDPQAGVER